MSDRNMRAVWEERSRREQAEFIRRIAGRLGRTEADRDRPPEHPFRGAPDFWQAWELSPEQRIERFMNNWTQAGGHAVRMASMEEVRRFIADFCKETGASSLVVQDQELLRGLRLDQGEDVPACTVWNAAEQSAEDLVSAAASADIGVAVADYAVAYTGTVVVRSGQRQGRSTSLLPQVFMAIVPVSAVKTRMGEVMADLDRCQAGQDIPAGIHFISGPSRSSDIENDLTIGVHGPGIVYALIVDA